VIEPKELCPGVLLSRSSMSADGDYSAVQLLNVSGKLHSLPAGLNLGVTLSYNSYTGSENDQYCCDKLADISAECVVGVASRLIIAVVAPAAPGASAAAGTNPARRGDA